jgi:hypothetical protein
LFVAEPELAVFEDDPGECDQEKDESEQEAAGLRILESDVSFGYVSLG